MTTDLNWLQAMQNEPTEAPMGSGGQAFSRYARSNRDMEQFIQQYTLDRLQDQGALFRVRNATLATGVAQTQNTTQDTAKPFICGSNPITSKKTVRLHRLFMRPTAVASGQVIQNIDVIVDTGGVRASAGTDYKILSTGLNGVTGYNNLRGGDANATCMSGLWVGVPVWTPGTNQQLAARFQPRTTTIPVVSDEYTIHFGQLFGSAGINSVVIPVSTTINQYLKNEPVVVVPPGCSFEIIPWAAGIGSAMSWEFDLIWSELDY